MLLNHYGANFGTAEDMSQMRLSQAEQDGADGVEAVLPGVTRAALFAS
ncbi:MAG: hypothetical protein ACYS21_17285 [Planctomycetota bacterium]